MDYNDGILLFIEVHGSIAGIEIGEDCVTWGEITSALRLINEKSCMGLTVVFSCCYGVYYFRQTSITDRVPYYVMFGVDKSIHEQRLLDTNKRLVDGFKVGLSLDEIESECNTYLHIHDINITYLEAGDMFVNAFDNYIKNECKPQELSRRTKDCYKLLKASTKPPFIAYDEFKRIYIDVILSKKFSEEKYNEIRDRFLMTDVYPELFERFHIDFDEMYENTNMAEALDGVRLDGNA